MRISRISIYHSLVIILVTACVDPFQIEDIGSRELLVVEAYFTDEFKNHQVFISKTVPVGQRMNNPETGADVWIESTQGETIVLSEQRAGVYETPPVAGVIGIGYSLHFQTAEGKAYQSTKVVLRDSPGIHSVYGRYLKGLPNQQNGIQIYVDTEKAAGGDPLYYRWNFVETAEVEVPFPSNWVWLGGNEVVFRDPPIGKCWVTDTLSKILIKNTSASVATSIKSFPLRFIEESSYYLRNKYSILVEQYPLSPESYAYWNNLRIINEMQGSLSDIQPGSIQGNVERSDASEPVLGYFDAGVVSRQRIFLTSIDFYNDGFKRPEILRSDCYEITPILAPQQELGEYMERYGNRYLIWEVAGMTPNAIFTLYPRPCCDCTYLGTNIKPSFWK